MGPQDTGYPVPSQKERIPEHARQPALSFTHIEHLEIWPPGGYWNSQRKPARCLKQGIRAQDPFKSPTARWRPNAHPLG